MLTKAGGSRPAPLWVWLCLVDSSLHSPDPGIQIFQTPWSWALCFWSHALTGASFWVNSFGSSQAPAGSELRSAVKTHTQVNREQQDEDYTDASILPPVGMWNKNWIYMRGNEIYTILKGKGLESNSAKANKNEKKWALVMLNVCSSKCIWSLRE